MIQILKEIKFFYIREETNYGKSLQFQCGSVNTSRKGVKASGRRDARLSGLHGIGVAVADRPEGPYSDPLKKTLVPGAFGYIDPSVFIDDDGQAYLFWGNNGLWYAKLNKDSRIKR